MATGMLINDGATSAYRKSAVFYETTLVNGKFAHGVDNRA